jgi:hypothetical protein
VTITPLHWYSGRSCTTSLHPTLNSNETSPPLAYVSAGGTKRITLPPAIGFHFESGPLKSSAAQTAVHKNTAAANAHNLLDPILESSHFSILPGRKRFRRLHRNGNVEFSQIRPAILPARRHGLQAPGV